MTSALAPHSLALVGSADVINVSGLVRLICRCGLETELLTVADATAAAKAHQREVMGATVRAE